MTEVKPLSIDEAIKLIQQQHVITLDKSDPILMLVTLLADYFIRLQVLNDNHKNATIEVMEEVVKKFINEVQAETEKFQSAVRGVAIENITAVITQQAMNLEAHKQAVLRLTFIAVISAVFAFVSLIILLVLQ